MVFLRFFRGFPQVFLTTERERELGKRKDLVLEVGVAEEFLVPVTVGRDSAQLLEFQLQDCPLPRME